MSRGSHIASGRDAWLSLTPEPERELPEAVATLRSGAGPPPDAATRERARIERLVVGARQGAWLAYLTEVVGLIESRAASSDPLVADARAIALQVIANHHGLLLGIPGRAAERTADVRSRLEDALVE